MTNSRKVFFYCRNLIPAHIGGGANLRGYTTVRAYLDLGYEVEILFFQTDSELYPFRLDSTLPDVKWTHIPIDSQRKKPLFARIAFRLGWPLWATLDYLFDSKKAVKTEIKKRLAQYPSAIHHFEYLMTACTAIDFPNINSVWGLNDIESSFNSYWKALSKRQDRWALRQRLRLIAKIERLAAQHCKLVLCISDTERLIVQDQWKCDHAALLPMSWPDEKRISRDRSWGEDGKLQLIHVGNPSTLASYSSLKFIIEEVFPLLSQALTDKIELLILGKIEPDTQLFQELKQLANPYENIRFLGFQPDIHKFYATADVQIVGSTEATGLRTRIIESFVYGLPVLSVHEGADGIIGLEPGTNILLASSASEFARHIQMLVESPIQLENLSNAGRVLYETYYSRTTAAKQLSMALHEHLEFDLSN